MAFCDDIRALFLPLRLKITSVCRVLITVQIRLGCNNFIDVLQEFNGIWSERIHQQSAFWKKILLSVKGFVWNFEAIFGRIKSQKFLR